MSMTKQEDLVYTVAEIAKILKVSEETVRGLIERGELKTRRVGRQHRITRAELDRFLSQDNQK